MGVCVLSAIVGSAVVLGDILDAMFNRVDSNATTGIAEAGKWAVLDRIAVGGVAPPAVRGEGKRRCAEYGLHRRHVGSLLVAGPVANASRRAQEQPQPQPQRTYTVYRST